MVRGTFANVRLRNVLVAPREGGFTLHLPTRELTTIFDASVRYQAEGIPRVVLAGKSYGQGSSRDWAAKGPRLLGVQAVAAESYKRIHRSNLVQMGVLPLTLRHGESWTSLGLTGHETVDLTLASGTALGPGVVVHGAAHRDAGPQIEFDTACEIRSRTELDYYRAGGVLPYIMNRRFQSSP